MYKRQSLNNKLLPLASDTMPLWSGGVLYVPASLFDGSATNASYGVTLGVSLTPVSYTHLDVYKRQDAKTVPGSGADIEHGFNICGHNPVSYTHLPSALAPSGL